MNKQFIRLSFSSMLSVRKPDNNGNVYSESTDVPLQEMQPFHRPLNLHINIYWMKNLQTLYEKKKSSSIILEGQDSNLYTY